MVEEQVRKTFLLAFAGGSILLKSPRAKRGVGTKSVLLHSKVLNLICCCGLSGLTLIMLALVNTSNSANLSQAAGEV